MKVWALGLMEQLIPLQEILTVKSAISSDVLRLRSYRKGNNIPKIRIPQSHSRYFRRSCKALSLDVRVMSGDNKEIKLKDT